MGFLQNIPPELAYLWYTQPPVYFQFAVGSDVEVGILALSQFPFYLPEERIPILRFQNFDLTTQV